jgi:hypothetical protein
MGRLAREGSVTVDKSGAYEIDSQVWNAYWHIGYTIDGVFGINDIHFSRPSTFAFITTFTKRESREHIVMNYSI